jgi:hypothetical protein
MSEAQIDSRPKPVRVEEDQPPRRVPRRVELTSKQSLQFLRPLTSAAHDPRYGCVDWYRYESEESQDSEAEETTLAGVAED